MEQHFSVCTKGNKRKPYILKAFLFVLLVCLSLTLIYNLQIIPALIPFAKAQITTEITKTMQSIVRSCVSSGDYNEFVKIKYNTNGEVTSLETNSINIALISSKITEHAANDLSNKSTYTVKIPLGNLSGGALLMGKGPEISIKVKISPKITCKIENEFYESGINQTLHRIVAKNEIKAYALLPFSTQEINVTTEYYIAETVIVGKVPEAYTKINRLDDELSESDIDDIYDFGATLK